MLRAWDMNKTMIVCPAMNTSMWNHPLTVIHMRILQDTLGFKIIDPISKKLACGDTGIGAMAEATYISDYVLNMFEQ